MVLWVMVVKRERKKERGAESFFSFLRSNASLPEGGKKSRGWGGRARIPNGASDESGFQDIDADMKTAKLNSE